LTRDEFNALTVPPGIKELGQPERVFVQSAWVAAVVRWFTNRGVPRTSTCPPEAGLVLVAVGVFVLGLGITLPDEVLGTIPRVAVILPCTLFGGSSIVLGIYSYCEILKQKAEQERKAAASETATNPGDGPIPGGSAYAVYPEALALVRGRTWSVVRWDEVREFRGRSLSIRTAKLVTADGRAVTLRHDVKAADSLYKMVERRTLPPMLDRARAALDAGETVWFGTLGISRDGLFFKDKRLGWDRVERLDIVAPQNHGLPGALGGLVAATAELDNLRIVVKERRTPWHPILFGKLDGWFPARWCSVPFWTLPNRAVFLRLILDMTPRQARSTISPALGVYMPSVC
jgi:hypothetical protein